MGDVDDLLMAFWKPWAIDSKSEKASLVMVEREDSEPGEGRVSPVAEDRLSVLLTYGDSNLLFKERRLSFYRFCSSRCCLDTNSFVMTEFATTEFFALCSLATEYLLTSELCATERDAHPPSTVGVFYLSLTRNVIELTDVEKPTKNSLLSASGLVFSTMPVSPSGVTRWMVASIL